MSDLSRRDFLKVSAIGLVAAGTGGLILQQAAEAQCPPSYYEDRDGDYIVLPVDYNDQRQYCALIEYDTVNSAEIRVVDWGQEFAPFDGSAYDLEETTGRSYFLRTICENVVWENPPGTNKKLSLAGATPGAVAPTTVTTHKCKPSVVPTPPSLDSTTVEKIGRHKIRFQAPNRQLVLPEVGPVGWRLPIAIVDAHLKMHKWDAGKGRWERVYGKQNSNKKYLKKAQPIQNVYNGEKYEFDGLDPEGIYHIFTEVRYDYGDADGISCRYLAERSDLLEINMRDAVPGHVKPKP